MITSKQRHGAALESALRRHGLTLARPEDLRPSGRNWLLQLDEAGWDAWEPSPECAGRTEYATLGLDESALSLEDRQGIHWAIVLLELIWRFGYGVTDEAVVNDWRKAAAIFVFRERCRRTGEPISVRATESLWHDLEWWSRFRCVRSYARLQRCDRVLRGILDTRSEARAHEFVSRWVESCEPALTITELRRSRPHLYLEDERARAGLGAALRMYGDKSLEPIASGDPRELLTFLEFTGRKGKPIIGESKPGEAVVLTGQAVTALRRVFGGGRKSRPTLAEDLEPRTGEAADMAEAARIAGWVDAHDRQESYLQILDEMERLAVGAQRLLVQEVKQVVRGEASASSMAELARRAGVDESTMREARDRLRAEVARRLEGPGSISA